MKYNIYKIALIIIATVLLSSCGEKKEEKEVISNRKTPVAVLNVQAQTFRHYFNVKANVEAVQYAIISPETPGLITKIYVSEGQRVGKGELLLAQSSSIIDAQIQNVKTQLDLAETTYNKQKQLWLEKHVGSEIQYLQAKTKYESLQDQLKTLKAQRDMKQLKAPFSGIVDKINLKEGELANPGMQVIQLVNLSQLKFVGDISETYLPVIHKGDSVDISFSTYPNLKLRAPIYRTGNIINPANRTFEIEVRSKNIQQKLKPNMIATIRINDYTKDEALVVPSIVIKKDFDKQFIFIAQQTDSSTIAKKIYVETGRSYKDQTIITKGLKINDKVIVKGYNIVSNGGAISIIN